MPAGERPKPSVTFRLAEETDVEEVVTLVESAYRGDESRTGWTTEAHLLDGQRTDAAEVRSILKRTGSVIILAEADGQVAGTCHVEQRSQHSAYFGMFAVRPRHQGAGLGDSLLGEACRMASGWGCRELRMTVIRQRDDLVAWYGRRGFAPTGEREPFPYGDERFGRPRREDLEFLVLSGPTEPPGATDRDYRPAGAERTAEVGRRGAGVTGHVPASEPATSDVADRGDGLGDPTVHLLRVTLLDVSPPVWRMVRVPSTVPLSVLHAVVQVAMGWENRHLHEWRVGDATYTGGDEEDWGEGAEDESKVLLADIAPVDSVLHYDYDFGDGWEHLIEVMGVEPYDATVPPLAVTAGARAAPPEDCGGPAGYEHLLDALSDPDDPEHDDMVEIYGDTFHPEEFDRRRINAVLEVLWRPGGVI